MKDSDGYTPGSTVKVVRNAGGQGGVDLRGAKVRVGRNYHSSDKDRPMTMVTLAETGAAVGVPTENLGRDQNKVFTGLGLAWDRIFGTDKRKKRKDVTA